MNGTNVLYKSFVINGSQDLMIAKLSFLMLIRRNLLLKT